MKKRDMINLKTLKKTVQDTMNDLGYRLTDPLISSPCDRFFSNERKYSFEFWYPVTGDDHTIRLKMSVVGNHSEVLTFLTNLSLIPRLRLDGTRIKSFEDAMDRALTILGCQ